MARDVRRWVGSFCPVRFARAVALGSLLVWGVVPQAGAHGEASWIMAHPDYGWCCGPKDCFWLDPGEVRIDGDDYVVDRFAIRWPIIGSFPSVDQRFWACYFMRGTDYQQLKCFFAPRPAS